MKTFSMPQGSPEWWSARLGKPTASGFHQIVQSDGKPSKSMKKYATRLANELFGGSKLDSWAGNESTRRGTFLEDEARRNYSVIYDVDCIQVGFCTDDGERWGCSPDFLVGDDRGGQIKCVNSEDHTEAILRYERDGSFDPGYKQQIQGEMFVTNRSSWDLVYYHPALPMLVINVKRDEPFLEKLLDGIKRTIEARDEILAALRKFGGAE